MHHTYAQPTTGSLLQLIQRQKALSVSNFEGVIIVAKFLFKDVTAPLFSD